MWVLCGTLVRLLEQCGSDLLHQRTGLRFRWPAGIVDRELLQGCAVGFQQGGDVIGEVRELAAESSSLTAFFGSIPLLIDASTIGSALGGCMPSPKSASSAVPTPWRRH